MNISFLGLTFYTLVAMGLYGGVFALLRECIDKPTLFIAVLTLLGMLSGITVEVERAIREEREYRNGRP